MKYFKASCLIFCVVQISLSCAWSKEVALPTNKTLVVPIVIRKTVLEVGSSYLQEPSDESKAAFLSRINPVQNPFTAQNELVPKKVETTASGVAAKPEVVVVYDDAAVLKVIASNLSKQVRGTLSRGDTQYLQLQGGSLLKSGSTFPARIPGAAAQGTYTIQVVEVTAGSLTLRLGESILVVPISNN